MGIPKNPNTDAATAANKRRGDETAAARLRAAGWTVTPPEDADTVRVKSGPATWLTAAEARGALTALAVTLAGDCEEIYPTAREADNAIRAYDKLRNARL